MRFRHVMAGAMLCLLIIFTNCDTMQDVKKMESETNNFMLLSASGLGGDWTIPKVCHLGAIPFSLGGFYGPVSVTTFSHENYFVIDVPASSSGNLNVYTDGTTKFIGYLYDYNCNEIGSDGDWSGAISMTSSISKGGKYWVYLWASGSSGTSFTIYARLL